MLLTGYWFYLFTIKRSRISRISGLHPVPTPAPHSLFIRHCQTRILHLFVVAQTTERVIIVVTSIMQKVKHVNVLGLVGCIVKYIQYIWGHLLEILNHVLDKSAKFQLTINTKICIQIGACCVSPLPGGPTSF